MVGRKAKSAPDPQYIIDGVRRLYGLGQELGVEILRDFYDDMPLKRARQCREEIHALPVDAAVQSAFVGSLLSGLTDYVLPKTRDGEKAPREVFVIGAAAQRNLTQAFLELPSQHRYALREAVSTRGWRMASAGAFAAASAAWALHVNGHYVYYPQAEVDAFEGIDLMCALQKRGKIVAELCIQVKRRGEEGNGVFTDAVGQFVDMTDEQVVAMHDHREVTRRFNRKYDVSMGAMLITVSKTPPEFVEFEDHTDLIERVSMGIDQIFAG